MADKKLTPMMELIEWMNTPADVIKDGLSVKQKATELLEKERQMVFDAFNQGERIRIIKSRPDYNHKDYEFNNSEQYYNEKFKTK